jgi:YbbR domain-containing protein
MPLREFLQQNFWLKCFALLLATLTWLTIRFEIGISQPAGNTLITQRYAHLKLTVLRNANDTRNLEVIPNEVAVTISGEANILRDVSEKDLLVFVNLTDLGDKSTLRKIDINRPRGVLIERIEPAVVRIELVPSTNSMLRSGP